MNTTGLRFAALISAIAWIAIAVAIMAAGL